MLIYRQKFRFQNSCLHNITNQYHQIWNNKFFWDIKFAITEHSGFPPHRDRVRYRRLYGFWEHSGFVACRRSCRKLGLDRNLRGESISSCHLYRRLGLHNMSVRQYQSRANRVTDITSKYSPARYKPILRQTFIFYVQSCWLRPSNTNIDEMIDDITTSNLFALTISLNARLSCFLARSQIGALILFSQYLI